MGDYLDCETPRGRRSIVEQNAILAKVGEKFGRRPVPPPSKTYPVDVFFEDPETGHTTSVAEVKSREATFRQLTVDWEGGPHPGYLITHQKIIDGERESAHRRVPFLVIVGLMPEYRIVYWQLTGPSGKLLWPDEITIARTPTQTTVNNPAKIIRANAYLPVARMRELPDATWGPVDYGSGVVRVLARPRPGISKLCRGCGTLLDQSLVAEGVDFHMTCRPRRRLRVVRDALEP